MKMYLENVDTTELEFWTEWRNWLLPRSVWCEHCNNTWFKWRIGVFELLSIDDGLRNMIIDLAPYDDMLRHIRSHGFLTLIEDWVRKVLQNITTLEEVRKLV
jgi:type II secretory ATPase GspE/PulE/Tfp pilus assembly ATPase PilB-like protein